MRLLSTRWLRRSLVVLPALVASTAFAAEGRYSLDLTRSEIALVTQKGGGGANFAHNHVLRASEGAGELRWDPQDPRATSITVSAPVASLVADEPEARRRHGELLSLSDAEREKTARDLLGSKQLDAKRFPELRFRSTGVRVEADGSLFLTGELTLHGVTKPVSAPLRLISRDDVPVGDCALRFKPSDFGIKPFSDAYDTIRNKDQMTLVLHVVGTPAPVAPTSSR